MLVLFIIQLLCAVGIKCEIKGKIVNGDRVNISSFAYAAFLFIRSRDQNFVCGASIMNQRILLTAAHCIDQCCENLCKSGSAFIGNENINKGMAIPLKDYIIHEHFDRKLAINDIGLVAVRGSLKLGDFVKRVAILNKPPNFKVAVVAGWGIIDATQKIHTQYLHAATQRIWPLEECRKVLRVVPDGTFCGGELHSHQYAAGGDSGSALVADGYIQLGLVSFIRPKTTRSIVIYTNVPLYYKWLMRNARKLHCRSKN